MKQIKGTKCWEEQEKIMNRAVEMTCFVRESGLHMKPNENYEISPDLQFPFYHGLIQG